MERPRFQFTIRGLLWATFWLALSFAVLRLGSPIANITSILAVAAAITALFDQCAA